MAWGTITIGPLTLKEKDIFEDVTNANSGERSIRIEGAETVPGVTLAELQAKQEDIMGLIGRTVPISFSRKSFYNGFYVVSDTNTEYEQWVEGPAQIRWSLALDLVGVDGQVDMESALANIVRANDFALTGERWHAPSIGHFAYQTGTALPSVVFRVSSDGTISVYRSIPAATNPRWTASVSAYPAGRSRITQAGIERTGTGANLTPSGWTAHNGLVRIRPDTGSGTFIVGAWDSGAWAEKVWSLKLGGTTVAPADLKAVTVTRNDYEMVTLRIVVQLPASASRYLVDLSIRRGSRFVEGYVQRQASGTITITPTVTETATDLSASGYMRATSNDADGNRFVVGSARTFTTDAGGGFTKSSVTAMDFFVGVELGGTGAVSGDAAVDLRNQYIAAMAEKVGVVRR